MLLDTILLLVKEKLPLPSVCNTCPAVPSVIFKSNKSLISLAIVIPLEPVVVTGVSVILLPARISISSTALAIISVGVVSLAVS